MMYTRNIREYNSTSRNINKNLLGDDFMKRIIILLEIALVCLTNCFAASLSWGMTLESFEKKFKAEKKYETNYYSIVYLPQNSCYKNEFDEFLLFGKDISYSEDDSHKKRLIRRIQTADYSVDECKEKIKNLNSFSSNYDTEKELEFPLQPLCSEEDALLGFEDEEFPSEYSFPVIFALLERPYNYAIYDGYKSPKKSHNYYCMGLFLKNGENYIILDDGYADNFFYKLQEYSELYELYNRINPIDEFKRNFISHIDDVKLNNLQNNKIKGPFGTFFTMSKDDLYLICKKDSKLSGNVTDLSFLNDKIDNYTKYYSLFSYAGNSTIKKFVPQKSSNSISEYYAIFDDASGLYQVFAIANYSRSLNAKQMDSYDKENTKSFSELKIILTEQYGAPMENSKTSLYWKTDDGIKIELFSENNFVKLYSMWDGKEYGGMDYFTCLVYTDTVNYEKLFSAEQNAMEQDKKAKEEAKREKEAEQKSFF